MIADVILTENTVTLVGNVSITADEKEIDINGSIAGYSFHDRTIPGNRYVLFADEGKAFIWKEDVGNIFTLEDDSISANKAKLFALEAEQISLKGSSAEYGFYDRANSANRFVMYANAGKIRFFKDGTGDIFTVDGDSINAGRAKFFALEAEQISLKGPSAEYGFYDGANPSDRFVMYANAGKIRFFKDGIGDIFTVDGDSISVNRAKLFALEAEQISLKGPSAEYGFYDRANLSDRFVMYANAGKIRFFKDGVGDIFTIADDKTLAAEKVKAKTLAAQKISTNALDAKSITITVPVFSPIGQNKATDATDTSNTQDAPGKQSDTGMDNDPDTLTGQITSPDIIDVSDVDLTIKYEAVDLVHLLTSMLKRIKELETKIAGTK